MDRRLRGLVITTLILLMACIPPDWNLDSGLFSGRPCKAPCWNNLTPGKSTASDYDKFVNSLDPKDWPLRQSAPTMPGCYAVQIADEIGPVTHNVRFSIDNGLLIFIESSPRDSISLQDLVAHLGPPEYYYAVLAEGDNGPAYGVEVYYPSQGLAFRVIASDVGFIRPDMQVLTIQYFAAGSLLSYMTTRRSCFMRQADALAEAQRDISTYVHPWTGFGKVQVSQAR